MNLAETSDLLTFIASLDNRRVDDAMVMAWHPIVAKLSFVDAQAAVLEHFGSSEKYLMPVHVVNGAREIDRDRRRRMREAREAQEQRQLEADPTRRDRSDEVRALIAELRDRLPEGDPDKLRRGEWLEVDRRRGREVEPNPHFDPAVLRQLSEEAE